MKVPLNLLFGSFFLFLTMFILIGCNVAAYQTEQAWAQYDLVVKEIEDSHFDEAVMAQMKDESRESGYKVEVVRDCVYEEQERYLIKLTYTIRIPVLEIKKERVISGYAV